MRTCVSGRADRHSAKERQPGAWLSVVVCRCRDPLRKLDRLATDGSPNENVPTAVTHHYHGKAVQEPERRFRKLATASTKRFQGNHEIATLVHTIKPIPLLRSPLDHHRQFVRGNFLLPLCNLQYQVATPLH